MVQIKLVGAVEKAEAMGYSAHQIGFGGVLGKYVASFKLEVFREKRTWKGRATEVNCYEDTEELSAIVCRFFDEQVENQKLEPASKVKEKKKRVLAKDRLDPEYQQITLF